MTRHLYIFVRSEGFYPTTLDDDGAAREHAEANPGTVRVEDAHGRVVWPAKASSPSSDIGGAS